MLQRFLTTYNRPLFQVWLLRTISLTWKHEKLEAKLLTALFHTAKNSSSGYKIQNNLKDCYNLLNVHDDCTEEELKEAYIRLAKIYHPDSQSETADPKKFGQVKEAYKAVKRKIEADKNLETIEDDVDDDYESLLKWRAPQHRQFLSHEGVGSGTMSERQKQYEQLRVNQATNRIYEYRLKKLAPEGENTLVAKDKRKTRTRKISNTIDRMVEDMILESMSKGSFDNLPGYGKPHKFSDKDKNPYIDKITAKLNQILIEDDLKPEWITMQKEIREDLQKARERLAIQKRLLGDPPYSEAKSKRWKLHEENFFVSIQDINEKINNFNLIVPILNKQMVHYNCDREIKNIFSNCDKYIPSNYDFSRHIGGGSFHTFGQSQSDTPLWSAKEIWKHIKAVFKS